jgi:hypothetical protein
MNVRSFLVLLLFIIASSGCKQINSSQTKEVSSVDIKVNRAEYQNAGKCTILSRITDHNFTKQSAINYANAAANRMSAAKIVWEKVAEERVERGTDFMFGWTNRLQARGYIEPMFLADIRIPLKFTGSNQWDYYEAMTVATKKEATNLARELSLKFDKTMRIHEIFQYVMEKKGGDPWKAAGYLGALTVWDRWNAEYLAKKNGGGRNAYTVLPKLFSKIGEGDITGQTYHFWGFVALIFGNGPAYGLAMGGATTYGYEIVKGKLQHDVADMEDYDIDNRAMAYALGMYDVMLDFPNKTQAQELHKKYLCDSKPAQSVQDRKDFSRSCEIWLGYAGYKSEADELVKEMVNTKVTSFLHFDDFFQCTVRAKLAPSRYSWRKDDQGRVRNFAYMRYAKGTSSEKTAIYSSDWIGAGLGSIDQQGLSTKYCKSANKMGGSCGGLRQTIALSLCEAGSDFKKCLADKRVGIDYLVGVNQHCLSSTPNKCTEQRSQNLTFTCESVNKTGGGCSNLSLECAKRYCTPSSAEFIQCKKDHKNAIKRCVMMNQHCLEGSIDRCVPLKEAETIMVSPMQ